MSDCITHPSDDDCGCCDLPQTPKGFVANAVYKYAGYKGTGIGTSTVSKEDAENKAEARAEAHARLIASCATHPIGALQLQYVW